MVSLSLLAVLAAAQRAPGAWLVRQGGLPRNNAPIPMRTSVNKLPNRELPARLPETAADASKVRLYF